MSLKLHGELVRISWPVTVKLHNYVNVPLSHLRSKETAGNISHIPSSPGHYNDIALYTGHYNDIARESCSFELFDLLSEVQTEVELHSLYRRVNSILIVGFSFKV